MFSPMKLEKVVELLMNSSRYRPFCLSYRHWKGLYAHAVVCVLLIAGLTVYADPKATPVVQNGILDEFTEEGHLFDPEFLQKEEKTDEPYLLLSINTPDGHVLGTSEKLANVTKSSEHYKCMFGYGAHNRDELFIIMEPQTGTEKINWFIICAKETFEVFDWEDKHYPEQEIFRNNKYVVKVTRRTPAGVYINTNLSSEK